MRLLWVVVLAGCATVINGRPEVVTWQDRLMPIASFQLNCPASQLTVVDLGQGEKAGVSGCGRREVFVYDGSRSWDLASESQTKPKDR